MAEPENISVHHDFEGDPLPTNWPEALAEVRSLRADNKRLAEQNILLHEALSRDHAFRGWTPTERFTCWVGEGPTLAKAAGVYVGIKVSDAKET